MLAILMTMRRPGCNAACIAQCSMSRAKLEASLLRIAPAAARESSKIMMMKKYTYFAVVLYLHDNLCHRPLWFLTRRWLSGLTVLVPVVCMFGAPNKKE